MEKMIFLSIHHPSLMMCWLLLIHPTPTNCLLEENPFEAHWGNSHDKVALASWPCDHIGDVELVTWQCELDDVDLATSPSGLGQLVKWMWIWQIS
jgi:hypothetical protein